MLHWPLRQGGANYIFCLAKVKFSTMPVPRPGGYSGPEVTLAPKLLKFTKNLKPYKWLYSAY